MRMGMVKPAEGVATEVGDPAGDIGTTLLARARTCPDGRAFTFLQDGVDETASLSWGQLATRAQSIAARLRADHPPSSRVLLLFPSGTAFIAAFFGCLLAGCVAVPSYPPRRHQKTARLRAIVEDCRPAVGLSTAELIADLESSKEALGGLPLLSEGNVADNGTVASRFLSASGDLALLQYTSGSTGRPKGVLVTRGNLVHNAEAIRASMGFNASSVLVSWLPNFHDFGLITSVVLPVHVGFHCLQMPPTAFVRQPVVWLRAIDRFRATHAGCPNFGFDLCVDKIGGAELTTLDLSSWRVALNGAEPVRAATLRRFTEKFAPAGFDARAFSPCFGMAESTLFVTGRSALEAPSLLDVHGDDLRQGRVRLAGPGTGSDGDRTVRTLVGCGSAPGDTAVKIVDPSSRREMPDLEIGEIWIAGPSVGQGYWGNPSATAQAFGASLAGTTDRRFLRTGDLGFQLNGELFVSGRIKDTIIVRGQTHYPQDIEDTVERAHPALSPGRGAAFALDEDGMERLIVVHEVRRVQLRRLNKEDAFNKVRGALVREHDLDPAGIVLLAPLALPQTSSGKTQRNICREMFKNGTLRLVASWTAPDLAFNRDGDSQAVAPSRAEDIEAWLAEWIAVRRSLPRSAVGLDIPFAEFGLDSLAAVELGQSLGTWLDRKIADHATLAWTYPTIRRLSAHLAGGTPRDAPKWIEPIERVLASLSEAELAQLLLKELSEMAR
jgi:acyl-CoA synthetase (AMP-forming)/AMP-acid ligase II/acyl carrier protein